MIEKSICGKKRAKNYKKWGNMTRFCPKTIAMWRLTVQSLYRWWWNAVQSVISSFLGIFMRLKWSNWNTCIAGSNRSTWCSNGVQYDLTHRHLCSVGAVETFKEKMFLMTETFGDLKPFFFFHARFCICYRLLKCQFYRRFWTLHGRCCWCRVNITAICCTLRVFLMFLLFFPVISEMLEPHFV